MTQMPPVPPSRHARQARFAPLGADGQAAIAAARVAVVGCGALGSVVADILVRAGVGALVLIDRDVLELSNLHRQALFTEADVEQALPKAAAAVERLRAIDATPALEARVADLDGDNAVALLRGAHVVVDGTDNFEARHVLNEACLELGLPWVHGACLGATAVAWPILPGGACFSCLVPDVPAPGETDTCETAGVLGPAVHLAAAVQAMETLKLASGRGDAVLGGPWTWNAWTGRGAVVGARRDPACPACGAGERRFLGQRRRAEAVSCGRNAVQLAASATEPLDLDAVAGRLERAFPVVRNRWLLRFPVDGRELTIFRDGRVLVAGTREPAEARALAARCLGG